MILFTIRKNSSDLLIRASFVITILFVLVVFLFADVEVNNLHSFRITFSNFSIAADSLLLQFGFIFPFIAILGFSKTFIELLDSSSLIFSKPISRTEFILKNTLGVFLLTFLYCICTCSLFLILFLIKGSAIPYQFILALSFLPLGILALYSLIIFLSLTFESYAVTVFVTFLYLAVIHPVLINPEMAKVVFSIENLDYIKKIKILKYILPNVSEGISVMKDVFRGAFEVQIIFEVLLSLVPVQILSVYLLRKKEF